MIENEKNLEIIDRTILDNNVNVFKIYDVPTKIVNVIKNTNVTLTKEITQDLVTFTKKLEIYQKDNIKDQNSDMSQQISKIINSSNLLLCFFAHEE